jgi:hypothetical protein
MPGFKLPQIREQDHAKGMLLEVGTCFRLALVYVDDALFLPRPARRTGP